MKINNNKIVFGGVWQKNVRSPKDPAKYRANNVYYETLVYRPFSDEKVAEQIKAKEGVSGFKYYEYEKDCLGHGVTSSIVVQEIKVGEGLNISYADYAELLKIKQAGEEATKKLTELGSIEMYSMDLPTSASNGATLDEEKLSPELVERIRKEV